jgi:hypothetical protein
VTALTAKEMMDIVLAAQVVEFRKAGTDDLCAMSLYPGEAAPLDYAECGGMLWVRLITAYKTSTFPAADNGVNKCAQTTLALSLEIAVMRPAPIPDDFTGGFADLPDDAEHTASTHSQLDDMEAMERAITKASKHLGQTVVGSYTPVGPVGGTVGGSWQIVVGNE